MSTMIIRSDYKDWRMSSGALGSIGAIIDEVVSLTSNLKVSMEGREECDSLFWRSSDGGGKQHLMKSTIGCLTPSPTITNWMV